MTRDVGMRGATTFPPAQRKQLMGLPRPVNKLNAAGRPIPPDVAMGGPSADASSSDTKMPPLPPARPNSTSAPPAAPPPPSRIPSEFHVHDHSGRIVFPSQRPAGERDISILAETLGAMLKEWRTRLDSNKPSFPLGAARWGVLQMCIYDMWCTLEEARIWDIGLSETERLAHFYSPALCAMLGRIRARLATSCSTTLSMSQRLQFELQRWHSQWLETNETLREAQQAKASLQQKVSQLQSRVQSLEGELELHHAAREAAGGVLLPLEQQCQRLQKENALLYSQLKQAQAHGSSARAKELTLKLTNDGLLEELGRWRATLGEGAVAGTDGAPAGLLPKGLSKGAALSEGRPFGGAAAVENSLGRGDVMRAPAAATEPPPAELAPLLALFSSYAPPTQRTALEAIMQAHAALSDPLGSPGGQSMASSFGQLPPPAPPRVGQLGAPPAPAARTLDALSMAPEPAAMATAGRSARLGALEELATTLTEEEAEALVGAIAARRAHAEAADVG